MTTCYISKVIIIIDESNIIIHTLKVLRHLARNLNCVRSLQLAQQVAPN